MPLQLSRPLVVFDIESTGLNIVRDRIIDIAMIKLFPNGEEKIKSIRINPGFPIPPETTAVHGITDEMVKDAPSFSGVANEIKQFIEGADLSGFNCLKFDIPLLAEEFLRAGIDFDMSDYKIIDAQRIFHKMEPRDLEAAYSFYCNGKITSHHNAESDARHTLLVLQAQVDKYESLPKTPEDIEKQIGGFQSLDIANRIIEKDNIPIFNFGKHKGKKVQDVFTEEPQYYDWIMKNDFALHTKRVLSKLYAKFALNKQA